MNTTEMQPFTTKWEYDASGPYCHIFTRTKGKAGSAEITSEKVHYSIGKKLGEGGLGKVYELIPDVPNKKKKAVKFAKKYQMTFKRNMMYLSLYHAVKASKNKQRHMFQGCWSFQNMMSDLH